LEESMPCNFTTTARVGCSRSSLAERESLNTACGQTTTCRQRLWIGGYIEHGKSARLWFRAA
jgi:hypothetical protein